MCSQNQTEYRPTTPDANRPPQLNETICGCRCRRAVEEDGHGVTSPDLDDASTLTYVNSTHTSTGSDHPFNEDSANAIPNYASMMRRRTPSPHPSTSIIGAEHWRRGSFDVLDLPLPSILPHRVIDIDQSSLPFSWFGLWIDNSDSDLDSLAVNEPGSGEQSLILSSTENRNMISNVGVGGSSPALVPGMRVGRWIQELQMEMEMDMEMEFGSEYYFLERPLRLTP